MDGFNYTNYIDSICHSNSSEECFLYLDDNLVKHSLSYDDVFKQINLFKTKITDLGLKPGSKVLLSTNNLFYSELAFIAASYSNLCVVLIDPNLPIGQMENMLSDIDVSLVLTDQKTYQKLESVINSKVLDITNNYKTLNDLNVNDSSSELDEMAIIFSSGTTANAKAIVLTYDSIINSAISAITKEEGKDIKYNLSLLPIYHISGIINLLGSIIRNLVIETVEHFNVKDIVTLFKLFNPNSFLFTPVVIEKMINELEIGIKNKSQFAFNTYETLSNISLFLKKNFDINLKPLLKPYYKNIFGDRFNLLVCSTSKLPEIVVNRINAYGLVLDNNYSSSECGSPITHTYGEKVFDDTVGKITSNPNASVKLMNIDNEGIGEIVVKTNSLMKAYYNDPELTKSSFTEDGYFRTGDLGRIDNGFLYITGRSKETIKLRNGKKLSPTDLENLLIPVCPMDNHVYISGYSKDNNEYDDIYAFFVDKNYSNEEKSSIKDKLIKYNNEVLKSYPIKDVIFTASIPLNSIGKVKRFELVKYIEDREIDNKYYSDVVKILSKYISINNLNLNESLNNLGIDSLSMYSIVVDIKEKYNKDILSFLSSSTTVQDLIDALESDKNNNNKLRKIKPSEIKEMAKLAADCFYDYPLYKVFYPNDEFRKIAMYYNCLFVIYKRQNYSYVNEDKSLYIAFKKPGDKSHPMISLFFKPYFLEAFIKNHNAIQEFIKAMRLLSSYGNFSESMMNKYYGANKDNYVENLFVKKDKQGNGIVFKALQELDDGKNVYAETHLETNVELFKKLGMEVVETSKWEDVNHYALLKKARSK